MSTKILAYSQFVNAAAIKRLIGCSQAFRLEFIEVNELFVVVRLKLGEFILMVDRLVAHFSEWRQNGARECLAQLVNRGPRGECFEVLGSRGGRYIVEIADDNLTCNCEDWRQHQQICKHGYAALGSLGLTSLEQYAEARRRAQVLVAGRSRGATVRGISID